MYFLRKGASGPVRGGGPEYQQTYLVSDGVLYCHTKDGGYAVGLKYSPCPRPSTVAAKQLLNVPSASRSRSRENPTT
jgi:hypothetical protein